MAGDHEVRLVVVVSWSAQEGGATCNHTTAWTDWAGFHDWLANGLTERRTQLLSGDSMG